MSKISIGIDFGITNTDLVTAHHDQISYSTFPSEKVSENYLKKILSEANLNINDIETIGVTGCLLYTSPSPRDATLSRMPSSA